jgi:hypothetical protein
MNGWKTQGVHAERRRRRFVSMNVQVHGCTDVLVQGCMHAGMQGCIGAGMQRCRGVLMQGRLLTRSRIVFKHVIDLGEAFKAEGQQRDQIGKKGKYE